MPTTPSPSPSTPMAHPGRRLRQLPRDLTQLRRPGAFRLCCDSPHGLAIDQRGFVWASNYYSDSVSEISSADNTIVSSGYQGLAHPVGVDGAGSV